MHDLVQEMGQKVVRQQCIDNPGKRSRLWMPDDIYTILRNNRVYFFTLYLRTSLDNSLDFINLLLSCLYSGDRCNPLHIP